MSTHDPSREGQGHHLPKYPPTTSIHHRIGANRDAYDTLEARRHAHQDHEQEWRREKGVHRTPPRVARRRDDRNRSIVNSNHNPRNRLDLAPGSYRSKIPKVKRRSSNCVGPRAFGSRILSAKTPQNFRAPHNFLKYDGNSNPKNWIEDYHLAMKAVAATNSYFIAIHPSIPCRPCQNLARALAKRGYT